MNLSNKVIKTKDVKVVGPKKRVSGEFIPVDFEAKKDNAFAEEQETGEEIEKIRKESLERITRVEKEAYEKGFSEGVKEGRDRAREELSSSVAAVEKLMERLNALKKRLWEESEKEILKLAFVIAEKVIHKEASTDRGVVLAVLSNAIRNVRGKEEMTIQLNPGDYDYIMEAGSDVLSNFCDMKNTNIEKDEQIEPGGAVIETHFGMADARLDQQINRIKEALPL